MIKVLFICHGNICRSPMAEYMLKAMVEKQGISENFIIDSAATSTEECYGGHGNPIYPPAQRKLREMGIGNTPYTDFSGKRARQITRADYDAYNYILCADRNNIGNAERIFEPDRDKKISLILDWAENEKRHGVSISDPWYTDDFDATYRDIQEGLNGFIIKIKSYK